MASRWARTQAEDRANTTARRVHYLSMEFLMGRLLSDSALNLGLLESANGALASFGVSLEEVVEAEPDAALGNGGLGRLAACFLDSLATMGVPGTGYGLRYEHGQGVAQDFEQAQLWYRKAAGLMARNPAIRSAFVSTNSITQGEQVGIEGHAQRPVLLQQPQDNHPQAEQQADRRNAGHQQLGQGKTGLEVALVARGRYYMQTGELDKAVDDLLAASGQFLEVRPHDAEVFIAPRLDVVPPRNRPRVLPEVEVE